MANSVHWRTRWRLVQIPLLALQDGVSREELQVRLGGEVRFPQIVDVDWANATPHVLVKFQEKQK